MKFRIFIGILTIILLSSCGSSKKATYRKRQSTRKKVVVLKPTHEKHKHNEVVQNKTLKTEPAVILPKNTTEYIERYAPIAIKEMKSYKIPASITLAQGILESGSGRSNLAARSNNHFGIKCHKGWEGHSVTHDDDKIGECFRKYKHPETSYEDHSKFLTTRSRYAKLFKLRTTDYKGWAYGLKRAGYATDPRYPKKLIGLIHKYKLHKYDLMGLTAKEQKIIVPTSGIYTVLQGDTLYSIARRNNISVSKLKKRNNLKSNNLKIGQKLILN